jgi:hypothetical protein
MNKQIVLSREKRDFVLQLSTITRRLWNQEPTNITKRKKIWEFEMGVT